MGESFIPHEGAHDLGNGHWFTFMVGDPEYHLTDDERLLNYDEDGNTLVGIIHRHPRPGGPVDDEVNGYCGGAIQFVRGTSEREKQRPIWQVISLDPLHIEPSLLCVPGKGCGSHGWIRDGKWIQA
jgi:hypothetical protein